jgi:hypothetical protein
MDIRQQLTYELRCRVQLLPQIIKELKELTDKNIGGMGIHQSQINTVKSVLDKMAEEQAPLINDFKATIPLADFTDKRSEIEQFLTTTNSIMATFRYIFAQRKESPLNDKMLGIADLVAAYCYKPCMQLANHWRDLSADHYREPPLTYLNAMLSPAAIARRHNLNQIGLKLYTDTENLLPISVISLPFHDTIAVWTFCSLYHEVGHLLDNDLSLRDELGPALTAALNEAGKNDPSSKQRLTSWEFWLGEMIADAFGVLLGGAAYGYALLGMLFRPRDEIETVGEDKHPNEYVRVYLLCELLRGTGVAPLVDAAQKIETTWHDTFGDIAELSPYLPEAKIVAGVLLNTKLNVLKNERQEGSASHALIEFGYQLAANHKNIDRLSTWLATEVDRPDPEEFPYQLVPAAAQLALVGVTEKFEETYQGIQQRTLDFIAEIKHDEFLAADINRPARQAYLNNMIKNLNFGRSRAKQA